MRIRVTGLVLSLALLVIVLVGSCANVMPVNTNVDSTLSTTNKSSVPGSDYVLLFRYGAGWTTNGETISGRYNQLDTLHGTYTKDMIATPSTTVSLILPASDMAAIYAKMQEIDFFAYPSDFSVKPPPGSNTTMVTPSQLYYLEVNEGSMAKTLLWNDNILNPDTQATKLRDLIQLIKSIIESKAEYKALPPASGGYL